MYDRGEKVEESVELENYVRYHAFLKKQFDKVGGSTKEVVERNINYTESLIECFGRPVI